MVLMGVGGSGSGGVCGYGSGCDGFSEVRRSADGNVFVLMFSGLLYVLQTPILASEFVPCVL